MILLCICLALSTVILFIMYLKKKQTIHQEEQKELLRLREQIKKAEIEQKNALQELSTLAQRNQNFETQERERKEAFKQEIKNACDQYVNQIEAYYTIVEEEYNSFVQDIQTRRDAAAAELEQLKSEISAGVEARLREQAEADQKAFYQIQISDQDIQEISVLNEIKPRLPRHTEVINKLIWTTFYQKKTTAMCNRVCGVGVHCGIYKITNLITDEIYIGQSVDISNRWKEHIKHGLGIDTSPTNKLYANMMKYYPENFTFEILKECSREELNKEEKMFIDLYQSDKYGLNSTKGGS